MELLKEIFLLLILAFLLAGFIIGLLYTTMDNAWLDLKHSEDPSLSKAENTIVNVVVHLLFVAVVVTRPITWSIRYMFVRD